MSMINSLLRPQPEGLTAWIEYNEGISFKLKFLPKAQFRRIVDNNTSLKYNPKTRERENKVDDVGLISDFVKATVIDWNGMTIRTASKLVPLDISQVPEEKLDEPQAYSHEDLLGMIKVSYDLEKFLQDVCTDITFFRPDQETEEKNS